MNDLLPFLEQEDPCWGIGVSQWYLSTMLFSISGFTPAGNSLPDIHILLNTTRIIIQPPCPDLCNIMGEKKKRLSLLSCPLRHFDLTLWNVLGKQKQALDLHPRSEWKTSVLSYCQKSLAPQLADSSPGQPLTFTTYWGHVQREWISANHRIANPGSEVFLNPAHNLIINPDPNCSLTQT